MTTAPFQPDLHPDAITVVNDPARYAGATGLRIIAWATLMTQRGNRVNQLRLGQLQRAMPALTVLTGLVPQRHPATPPTFDGAA